ncbi:hypothetical protein V6N11_004010 [Hibiscus sabdariffa]|uniref:Uncharacterized protein n=1 Tax=Hibiscus sabdariffa TaxID=183260 RepID=A0ABR2SFW8_9ROSI
MLKELGLIQVWADRPARFRVDRFKAGSTEAEVTVAGNRPVTARKTHSRPKRPENASERAKTPNNSTTINPWPEINQNKLENSPNPKSLAKLRRRLRRRRTGDAKVGFCSAQRQELVDGGRTTNRRSRWSKSDENSGR